MKIELAVIAGDGIGPEVVAEGIKALQAIGKRFGHSFNLHHGLFGGIAIDRTGEALPAETLKMCRSAQAVLLGAVGGPKWDDPRAKVRPEDGLLAIRKGLGLFANSVGAGAVGFEGCVEDAGKGAVGYGFVGGDDGVACGNIGMHILFGVGRKL